jgi:hypothetical protein
VGRGGRGGGREGKGKAGAGAREAEITPGLSRLSMPRGGGGKGGRRWGGALKTGVKGGGTILGGREGRNTHCSLHGSATRGR